MKKLALFLVTSLFCFNAFAKDITIKIMNNNYFTIDTNKIDSIEYLPVGGVVIKYDGVDYYIYIMHSEVEEKILEYTDSKYMFKAMNKLIHPTKDQPEIYNKLRAALDIKPDASNVDIIKAPENETIFIVHWQVNDVYFCHHATCNKITYKGDNKALIDHLSNH
jgi:hypothetical protein